MRESASAFTIPELLFVFERVLETLHRLANGGKIALLSEKHNEDQISANLDFDFQMLLD